MWVAAWRLGCLSALRPLSVPELVALSAVNPPSQPFQRIPRLFNFKVIVCGLSVDGLEFVHPRARGSAVGPVLEDERATGRGKRSWQLDRYAWASAPNAEL